MKRYLIFAFLLLVAALAVQTGRLRRSKAEVQRLDSNQTALMSDVAHYRTRTGQEVAAKEVLTLRVAEFERLRAADAAAIRDLGIKLRRVEATARTATATVVELRAALRDTIVVRPTKSADFVDYNPIFGNNSAEMLTKSTAFGNFDTMRVFRWRDPWVEVEGLVGRDSVECRIESTDTLRQIIHRVPKRFWFIRWGTKAIRQEIISSNPHTRVVYAEYVKFDK